MNKYLTSTFRQGINSRLNDPGSILARDQLLMGNLSPGNKKLPVLVDLVILDNSIFNTGYYSPCCPCFGITVERLDKNTQDDD